MDELVQYIIEHIQINSAELMLVFLSALPITELRGAIPLGILFYKIDPVKTYIICCLGNMLPVIPLLLFFGKFEQLLQKYSFTRSLLQWYLARVRKKTAQIERYTLIGLTLFVAVPLPVTGAWTGSIAAFIMGLDWKRSCVSIGAGICIAGILVTVLTIGGYTFYSFL